LVSVGVVYTFLVVVLPPSSVSSDTEMLLRAGSNRSADAADANPHRRSLHRVETRQYRSRAAHFASSHAYDRVALVAGEVEPQDRQVEVGAPGVSDEVLGREPHLSLEDPPVELRVGLTPEFDSQVAPAGLQVFRQVFHEFGSTASSTWPSTACLPAARSATSTPTWSWTGSTAVNAYPASVNASASTPTVAGSSTSGL